MQLCMPGIVSLVLIWLYRKKQITGRWLLLLLVCTAGTFVLILTEWSRDGKEQVTELPRNLSADAPETVALEVELEEERHPVGMVIPGRIRSSEEKQEILERQAEKIDAVILGKNLSPDRIEWNLNLPAAFEEAGITALWTTDHPEWITWDGVLLPSVPEDGGVITLTGTLFLDEESLAVQRTLTVFPSRESSALGRRLQQAADESNTETDAPLWILPAELDGRTLKWYRQSDGRGALLCLAVLLFAILLPFVQRKRTEQKLEMRRRALQRQYPGFVSRLHLLLCAGLSMRKAFERMAADARTEDRRNSTYTEITEEILRAWTDMENGVSEQDAWLRFGERCGLPSYRELSLMLAQNRLHGGVRLSEQLEREAQMALDSRRRQARAEGEKVSIRLILPMGAMLTVVMALIMIPAMLQM